MYTSHLCSSVLFGLFGLRLPIVLLTQYIVCKHVYYQSIPTLSLFTTCIFYLSKNITFESFS
jgi:hypothetical protein